MSLAVIALGFHRIGSALYSPIQDCDEIFNYFEPLHYYQYNVGFQSWEYVYSLRSWFYILLHNLQLADKITRFYSIRVYLSLFAFISQLYLFFQVRQRDKEIANGLALFMIGNGFFISTCSFLPSSFGMIFLGFAFAFQLQQKQFLLVLCVTIAGIWGWPFCLFYGLIYIVQMFIEKKLFASFFRLMIYGLIGLIITVFPLLLVDSMFYNRWTFPPWNLIEYNVLGDDGPDLYGVEPWYFYILNGILNFNIGFVLALLSMPILFFSRKFQHVGWFNLLGFYGWLLVFSIQPHKEERFMYVSFPFLCFNASIGLNGSVDILESVLLYFKKTRRFAFKIAKWFKWFVVAIFLTFTFSRTLGLVSFYSAPMKVYPKLFEYQNLSVTLSKIQQVCVGKEWYRFPSHYFIPHGMKLVFIKSHFKGLLPTAFPQPIFQTEDFKTVKQVSEFLVNAPRNYTFIPTHINTKNKQEPGRLVNSEDCDFLVDLESSSTLDTIEPNYGKLKEWQRIFCVPFLDAKNTGIIARSFYFGSKKWIPYCLYRRLDK